MVVTNLLYKVGSRNEKEDKTGFAHLFEHLMFGGSDHYPDYDTTLQQVGGDNNAFTSPDITNYFNTLPSANVDVALALEADRMASLTINSRSLDVQRGVVIEEFKQRYLNQPYGDVWHHLRPLAYHRHGYKWPTIGKDISHIENASLEDVQEFFDTYYAPDNAVLSLAGKFDEDYILSRVEHWFGGITKEKHKRLLPAPEPAAIEYQFREVEADVPFDALYMVFRMPGRIEDGYHLSDLMSEILGHGKNSRLHQRLVKKEQVASSATSFVTGSVDPGLIVVQCMLNGRATLHEVEKMLFEEIEALKANVLDCEAERVRNQAKTAHAFQEIELFNRAYVLAFGEFMGNANIFNEDPDIIERLQTEDFRKAAERWLHRDNAAVLHYKKKS